ncbi:arsenate reductase/protein-tyrosine-phosphatase family protein [Arthrobacter sp. HY1533]|uniref:arsenate reductase/protein-tyrosine-phosphatase family protein n=1 Tax=Arthrobacter sp. HY1533 TaxID=2970919 RepID=UPI0022B9DCC0|nr:low molecular weight phosphatase family protein [Arthrobacter sp. HY1533]
MTSTPPFRILAVCTGNICRSPMVERLLQAELDEVSPGGFRVTSAGTGALIGHGIEPHVEGFIRVMGASAADFQSRQLTPDVLKEQDLVIALTRAHRSSIVELQPALLKKTFTLLELARILPNIEIHHVTDPRARWESMVPLALRARSLHRSTPQEDDVVDPYRRSDDIYEQMRRDVLTAIGVLAAWANTRSTTEIPGSKD